MLTKLIRYEFRSSSRLIPFVYLAVVILAAMGALTSVSKSVPLFMISYVLLLLAGSAALIITYIVIFVRFYRGMYGSEGYLAHTLPVDGRTLYLSKTIVSFVWMVISVIVTVAAWMVAFFLLFRMISTFSGNEPMHQEVREVFSMMLSAPFLTLVILSSIVGWLSFLAIVFFCITLSNVKPFSKLGIGSAVLAYLAISLINYIVTFILMAAVPFSIEFSFGSGWHFSNQNMWSWFLNTIQLNAGPDIVIGLGVFLPQLFFAFALPFFTIRLMERKTIVK